MSEHNAEAFIAATAPLFAPGPQSDCENVICPHCRHEYKAEAEDCTEEHHHVECERCRKSFTLFASIEITYHTTP